MAGVVISSSRASAMPAASSTTPWLASPEMVGQPAVLACSTRRPSSSTTTNPTSNRRSTCATHCPTRPPPAMTTWSRSPRSGRFTDCSASKRNHCRRSAYSGAVRPDSTGVRMIVAMAVVSTRA